MPATPSATPPSDEDQIHRNRARAESFGSVADQYDRARPTYPDALIVDLLMTDPHQVLDVGCGTGKAARLLAAHGVDVLGVEIDDGMAAVARRHGIEVEVAPFETWDDAGRRFDLLVSGQAWHWVDPVAGAAKALRVLRPGGAIALFWNMGEKDRDVQAAVDEVYRAEAPELVNSMVSAGGTSMRYTGLADALADAGFADVTARDYPWQRRYTRAEWLDLLPTHSDHHLLPAEQRERVMTAVGDVIDRFGGSFVAHYTTHAILGRAPS